jgi:hypothetical protein
VLADTARRQELVRAGLVRASGFTFARTAQDTLDAYEEAAAR